MFHSKEVEICCIPENIGFLDYLSSSSFTFKERGKEYAMKFSFSSFKKEMKIVELKREDIKGLANLMLIAKPELNFDRISLHLERLIGVSICKILYH